MSTLTLDEVFNGTIFLLGAGASYELGCKVSTGMLQSLKEDIYNIKQDDPIYGDYRESFTELYNFLNACLAYQSHARNANSTSVSNNIYQSNVEDFILTLRKIINRDSILPLPLVGSWSDKLMLLQIRQKNIFHIFLDFIYKSLVHWLKHESDDKLNIFFKPIKEFIESTIEEDYKLRFFSLNYDLTLEHNFNRTGTHIVNTGFNKQEWNFNFMQNSSARIDLYKIHGSLDWYIDKEKEIIQYDIEHKAINESSDPSEIKPHIILGFENKLFSIDPFFTLIQELIVKLKDAKLIIVIGYSFFDNYLNNIIMQSIAKESSKKLLIVDPKWAKEGLRDFVNYVKYVQQNVPSMGLSNYGNIYEDRIEIYKGGKDGAGDFYKEFFANKAAKLIEKYSKLSEEENPF